MNEEVSLKEQTCDHCGGRLMRSRDWIITGYPYWLRPWGGSLKMSAPIVPFACLDCGRVVYILRDIHMIKRDFSGLTVEEKKEAYSNR
jgi:hypothetical protein